MSACRRGVVAAEVLSAVLGNESDANRVPLVVAAVRVYCTDGARAARATWVEFGPLVAFVVRTA